MPKIESCLDLGCDLLRLSRVPGRGYPRNIWHCPVRDIAVGYTVELMPQKNCPTLQKRGEAVAAEVAAGRRGVA